MTYLHLPLAHSNGQGQGHALLDSKHLGNGDRCSKIIFSMSCVCFRLTYLYLTNSNGQFYTHLDSEYLGQVEL